MGYLVVNWGNQLIYGSFNSVKLAQKAIDELIKLNVYDMELDESDYEIYSVQTKLIITEWSSNSDHDSFEDVCKQKNFKTYKEIKSFIKDTKKEQDIEVVRTTP